MFQKFIGDKAFYRRVGAVAVPVVIQYTITNFVSLLDNIMVGQVGTLPMSGVAIVNYLMFIFNLCIFGAMAGAGIFTAQFHGCQDHEGIRRTFRFKMIVGLLLSAGGIALFFLAGTPLISLYLQSDSDPADAAQTLSYGLDYLQIMLLGLIPFAISNAYASTLRETGMTTVPMIASVSAVLTNLVLNYVLIFGHLGAPVMGVRGAALATVISRFVELTIVLIWTHCHTKESPFVVGAFRSVYIPGSLLKNILIKGMPLLLNEFLFATGTAMVNQCYSVRGLDVVAATNISNTIYNLASVAYLSMGTVIGIIMGQMMGAGSSKEEVRSTHRKLTALAMGSCAVFSLILLAICVPFPRIYNTTADVRAIATQLIIVSAVIMPVHAYIHAVYFAMRSGGKTMITFFFDCGFIWLGSLPLAYSLSRFTAIPIVPLFILCSCMELLKSIIGYFIIRSDFWIRNLTEL
ncbi:MAG: MATE family efflux transporter [Oscillospiraceae bacterium]|nr:MATE family efflux transporter [Oscillospiraceae bacterium]